MSTSSITRATACRSSPDGTPSPVDQKPLELKIKRIPFILLDIGESLIKDAAHAQIAMLNLSSSDVSYALRSNFPFLTKQEDMRAAGAHLKQYDTADGTAMAGGQPSQLKDSRVGVNQGLVYDANMERPGFINPSSEPLKASLMLQDKLEQDIRKCVNLAIQTLATRASAESKQMDNQGLEGGLSYIGLVLENAERLISEYWAAYESIKPENRQIATVKYPDRYSLKTDSDRIRESNELSGLMSKVPGQTGEAGDRQRDRQFAFGRQDPRGDPPEDSGRDRHGPLHDERPERDGGRRADRHHVAGDGLSGDRLQPG